MYSQRSRLEANRTRTQRRKVFILAAALIFLFMGAVVFYLLVTPPQSYEPRFTPAERNMLASDFQYRVQQFSRKVADTQSSPATLEVNQRELNAYIQSSPRIASELQSEGISNPAVKLEPDTVTVSADVLVHGIRMPVTVTGTLISEPGSNHPSLQVRTIKVGKLGVPHAVTRKIASRIDRLMQSGGIQSSKGTLQVRVTDGKLVVVGQGLR